MRPRIPLFAFGNVAVGWIAVGNVAVGVVAVGVAVSIGPFAVGVNAVGFLLAVGVNAVGLVDLAIANGAGVLTFSAVNGLGAFGHAFTNWLVTIAPAVLLVMTEAAAAPWLLASAKRPRLTPFRKLRAFEVARGTIETTVIDADDEGLTLEEGGERHRVAWRPTFDAKTRSAKRRELNALPQTAYVRLRRHERVGEGDDYRRAPEASYELFADRVDLPDATATFRRVMAATMILSALLAVVGIVIYAIG